MKFDGVLNLKQFKLNILIPVLCEFNESRKITAVSLYQKSLLVFVQMFMNQFGY